MFTAAAFSGRKSRWPRWFAMANGPAALLVLISYISNQLLFGIPAGFLVPAYAISVARWFRRFLPNRVTLYGSSGDFSHVDDLTLPPVRLVQNEGPLPLTVPALRLDAGEQFQQKGRCAMTGIRCGCTEPAGFGAFSAFPLVPSPGWLPTTVSCDRSISTGKPAGRRQHGQCRVTDRGCPLPE